jgi:hypothetical protein
MMSSWKREKEHIREVLSTGPLTPDVSREHTLANTHTHTLTYHTHTHTRLPGPLQWVCKPPL